MSFIEQPPLPGENRPEPAESNPASPTPAPPPPYGRSLPPTPYSADTYTPVEQQPGYRPGCLIAGVVLAACVALSLLCGGFSFLYLPSADEAYKNSYDCYTVKGEKICGRTNDVLVKVFEENYGVSIETLALIFFGLAIFVTVMTVGVWRMKRWGWWLFMLDGAFWFGLWLVALFTGRVMAPIPLLILLGALVWFGRNRWRFV